MNYLNPDLKSKVSLLSKVDRQLALSFGVLILFLMMTVLVVGGIYLNGVMDREEKNLSMLFTQVLAASVSRVSFSGRYHAQLLLEDTQKEYSEIRSLLITDVQGRVLASSIKEKSGTLLGGEPGEVAKRVLAQKISSQSRQTTLDGESVIEITLPYRGGFNHAVQGVLQVSLSRQQKNQDIANGIVIIAITVIVLFFIGILLVLKLSQHFGGPIKYFVSDMAATLNAIPDLLFELDGKGRYLQVMANREALLADTRDRLLGRTVKEVLSDDASREVFAALEEAEKTGESHGREISILLDDGLYWFELSVARKELENVDLTHFIVLSRDITERKKMEDALRSNAERFNRWKESNFIGILHTTANGKVLDANNTLLNMLGYSRQDVLDGALDWTELTPAEFSDLDEKAMQELAEMGYWTPFEKEYFHKDGSRVPILIGGSVFYKGGDEFIFFIVDLSIQKQQEDQIRRTQKMDALGKLTGGIAHDYNNMLGIIMGYAELLENALTDQPRLEKYAHEIQHASKRGAKLTQKLLAFSRKKVSEADRLNLNALLKSEQLMLEKTLTVRIKLVLDLAEDLWATWLDDSDMEDAILNISINAMHAIDGNGQLTIRTSNEKINPIDGRLLDLAAGDYVLLSITDTGCGMDEETRAKLFEPFYTTKGEMGTGLGLSQVYGFVYSNGGAIKIYSEPGQGTRVALYFPRHDDTDTDNLQQLAEEKSDLDIKGSETILLVDDELALLSLNSEILSHHGFNVITAENAKQALDILEHQAIDLMLSDIIMPEMDGYQLASIVQEKYPSVKIQLASGFAGDRNVDMVDISLQQNILLKPFNSQDLLQRVSDLLDD